MVECHAMKVLLTDNRLAATISIAGMSIGVCRNDTLVSAIDFHMQEIEKFIEGEENDYE